MLLIFDLIVSRKLKGHLGVTHGMKHGKHMGVAHGRSRASNRIKVLGEVKLNGLHVQLDKA